MKFNVEAKVYNESLHYYWRLYPLRRYNGKVHNSFTNRETKKVISLQGSKLTSKVWIVERQSKTSFLYQYKHIEC